ncbi:MAG: amidase domain-containing protein [Planifilum fimeticola]
MEKRSSRIKRSITRKRIVWIGAAAVLLLSASLAYAGFNSGEESSTPPSAAAEKSVADVKEEPSVEELAKATDEELVDHIHYYNEISLSKEEIQRSHPIATKIVNQKAKQQNVKPDLDNPRYRELAMEAGLELEGKTPEEQKDIADFAKKADQYENKKHNQRIKELQDKAKKEGLTEEERAELISLLPIKNPGPKLKPEPKKEAEKKPSTPSEEPVKTPGKEEQNDKQQDGDGQPNPKEDDKQDGKPKDDVKDEPRDGKGAKPGEEKQKDTGRDEPQDEDQRDDRGDGNQDGDGRNGNVGDENGQDGSDDGQNGNGDGQDSEQPEPNQPPLKTEANGYNRAKAVEYAYKWWNKRNNEEYGFYSRERGGCYDCWYDCTNFVSQVIKNGGIKERVGKYNLYDYWFYNDDRPALTWSLAHSFYLHMKNVRHAQNATWPSDLQVGDIISVDFEGDGQINHSVVITKIQNGQIFATYHSSDNKDKNITDWLLHYDVFAWKMETVKNNY